MTLSSDMPKKMNGRPQKSSAPTAKYPKQSITVSKTNNNIATHVLEISTDHKKSINIKKSSFHLTTAHRSVKKVFIITRP